MSDLGSIQVEVIPIALTFRRPYVTATGSLDQRQSVLLRLRDENGITALGEGVPMSLRGGETLEQVVTELLAWGQDVESTPASAPARCAVAIALKDLEAKRTEVPLWQLLGAVSEPRPLTCNATITAGSPAEVVSQCEEWATNGFDVFKLKAGPDEAVELASEVRAALGWDAWIRIDANGTWGERSAEILNELEPVGIELVEEPVTGLDRLSKLARQTEIPLVADESVNDPVDAANAAFEDACTAATVKLTKIGGLEVELGGYLPTYLSSALDSPVGIAAAAHAAQTLDPELPWPGIAHGLATERLFRESLCSDGPLLEGNQLRPPSNGPGLGISLDEEVVTRIRLD